MNSNTHHIPALAVHLLCVAVILGCFTLAQHITIPGASEVLVGAALWLWGKLGFKPAKPVLEGILQNIGPAEAARMASMEPPPPSPKADSAEEKQP